MISIIVAMDKNRVIGSKGMVPWRLRDDLVRLKQLTTGHTVILGRKTYDSMAQYYKKSGREMPGQQYIVVTRNDAYEPAFKNAVVAHSVKEALQVAYDTGDDQVFVLGGGNIYEQALSVADRIYLTKVAAEVVGDTYFPALKSAEWQEISWEHHEKDEKNEYDYDIVVLERA